MDSFLFHLIGRLFELSPFDRVVSVAAMTVAFGAAIMRMIRWAGDEHLSFLRWRKQYREEKKKLLDDSATVHEVVTEAKPRLSA